MKTVIRPPVRNFFLIFFLTITLIFNLTGTVRAQGTTLPAQMNKGFSPVTISAGGISTLSINIYNPNAFVLTLSSSPAAWVDTLPENLFFASPANPTTTCGGTVSIIGNTISLIGGTVPAQVASTPGSCTVTVRVTSTVPGNKVNTIPENTLVATDPTGTISVTNTTSASATLGVNLVQSPSLSKAYSSNTVYVSQPVNLTITIRNNDSVSALTSVNLTDNLPTNLEVNSAPASPQCNGGTVTYTPSSVTLTGGSIPVSSTCTVVVSVRSTVPSIYNNIIPAGAISTTQGVTNTNPASAPLNVQTVRVDKSFSPTNFQVGGTSTVTLTIRNSTSTALTGVELTDPLPTGLTVYGTPASPQCNGGTVTSTASSVTLTGGSVPAGTYSSPGTCTITFQVTSSTAATYTNSIAANSLYTDQGTTNVTTTNTNITVYGTGLGMSLTKTFSPTTIAVNGVSRMTLSITAPSDIPLTNFSISDALPAGMQVASVPNATTSTYCVGGTFSPVSGDTLLTYTGGSIAAGRNCQLAVNVTGTVVGTLENTISPANISNDQNRNIGSNVSRSLVVAGLSVAKSFYPTSVSPNGVSTLTIQLTNINEVQMDSVSFTDTLPGTSPNQVVVNTSPVITNTCGGTLTAVDGSNTISLTGGYIPAQIAGVPGTCTVNVEVVGLGSAQTHRNTLGVGSVTGTLHGTTTNVSNTVADSADLTIGAVSIEATKSFDPLTVFGGSASTLRVTLTNGSSIALTGISFTDNLPQGTGGGMYVANPPNPNTGTCGGTITAVPGAISFSYSGGSLPASGSCYITVNVGMNVNGNLTNSLGIGAVTTANGASNTQIAEASLTNTPGVSISKAFGPNPISSGSGTSTLTFTLQNTGNFALNGLRFTDVLPTGLTVPVPPTAAQCGGTVNYDPGTNSITLTGGTIDASDTCNIVVDVSSTTPGEYLNCIPADGLNSDEGASNHDEACDTLRVVAPPAISKAFSPVTIAAGQNSVLTFTVSNPIENTIPLTGVGFTDTFPVGLTIASVPNPNQCGGLVTSTASSVTLSGGTLAVNSSCTVIVSVTSASGGSYLNTSDAVTSTNGGTGNTASATLEVVSPPAITKTFSPDPIAIGGTSVLTFTINNPNTGTSLTGVNFTDVFPTGLVVDTPTGESTSNCGSPVFSPTSGSGTISFSGGTIPASSDCTVSVNVTSSSGGTYSNTSGNVSSTNGGQGNTANDTLTVAGAGLSLTKSTTNTSFQSTGSLVSYDYLLTNTGDVTLYAPFTVTDDHIGSPVGTPFTCGAAASLDPGDTTTCNATYTVTDTDVTNRTITNIATANAMDAAVGGSVVPSNQSSVTVRLASLRINKSTPTTYFSAAGNTITYNYTLTNTGNVTLYPPYLVSDDHINGGVPFVCSASAPTTLPVGGNIVCSSKTYSVTAADVTAGSVVNNANATALDLAGVAVTSNTASVTVYRQGPPLVSKVFSPSVIPVGTISTLTFTITNPATNVLPLTGVGIVDNLPANMTVAQAPLSSQCGGSVTTTSTRITLTGGTILPSSSCTVTVLVTSSLQGSWTNTSNAVTSTNGGNGTTASAVLDVVVPPTITKAFTPTIISVGGDTVLSFTLANNNASTILTGIEFTDDLASGLQVSTTPAATISGCSASTVPVFSPAPGDTTITLSNASIAGGGTCTISVNVTGVTSGTKLNTTSSIISNEGGTGATSNTVSLLVNNPALSLVKTIVSGNPYNSTGNSIAYSYRLTNTGNVTLIGNGIGGLFTVTDDRTTVTCPATPAGLDPGDHIDCTATYTVTLNDMNTGSVTNTATGHGLYGSTPVDTNTDSQTATATQSPELTLDKTITAFANYAAVGQVIQYQYLITNTGNVTVQGAGTSGEFTVDDDHTTVTCPMTPTELNPTQSITCTGSYTVVLNDMNVGSVQNIATAHGQFGGSGLNSNTDTATAISLQDPQLTIDKTIVSGNPYVQDGDIISYSYELTNSGNVTLTSPFTVTDDHTTVTCPAVPTSLDPFDTITCTADYTVQAADITFQSITNTASGHAFFGAAAVDSAPDTARADIMPGSIIGVVYFDRNLDQTQQLPRENGLDGVTIDIYDQTGATLIISVTTSADGSFSSGLLLPGVYRVVENDPLGYVSTTPNLVTVTVTPGGTTIVDYGDYRGGTVNNNRITGHVYVDADSNGVRDTLEAPLAGVTVELYDAAGTLVATTLTEADGSYLFNNLAAGVYSVAETNPAGYSSTTLDHVSVTLTSGSTSNVDFGDLTGVAVTVDPAVTKQGVPANARIGDTVIFTITVGNNGTSDALNVVITDTMPDFLDIIQITIDPERGIPVTITGQVFTIDFGTITPSDLYTIIIVTRVNNLGRPPGGANNVVLASASAPQLTTNDVSAANVRIVAVERGGMPETGFAPGVITVLPDIPDGLYHDYSDLTLEIPSLGIRTDIVGLSMQDNSWDISWLDDNVAFLEETAFPSWNGNSLITGHVYKSDGTPGPFLDLHTMRYGDPVFVYVYGYKYRFEVREVLTIPADDMKSALKHEEYPWITLMTCKGYDPDTGHYISRLLVRAVLIKLES